MCDVCVCVVCICCLCEKLHVDANRLVDWQHHVPPTHSGCGGVGTQGSCKPVLEDGGCLAHHGRSSSLLLLPKCHWPVLQPGQPVFSCNHSYALIPKTVVKPVLFVPAFALLLLVCAEKDRSLRSSDLFLCWLSRCKQRSKSVLPTAYTSKLLCPVSCGPPPFYRAIKAAGAAAAVSCSNHHAQAAAGLTAFKRHYNMQPIPLEIPRHCHSDELLSQALAW